MKFILVRVRAGKNETIQLIWSSYFSGFVSSCLAMLGFQSLRVTV